MYDASFGLPLSPPRGQASVSKSRSRGLGFFHALHDDTIFRIIRLLPDHDVLSLSVTSPAFYFYAADDLYVWKRRCLNVHRGQFKWKGTWKRTALLPPSAVVTRPLVHVSVPPDFYSPRLCQQWYRQYVPLDRFSAIPKVDRRSGLSVEEFCSHYMAKGIPVIVTDALSNWPAKDLWRIDLFLKRFGEHSFKTDEVIDGKKIFMPFSNYLEYFSGNADDDPIYLFDPDFADHAPTLLNDYTPSPYFSEDFFSVLGEEKRPLYRWLVVGPKRSGSCFHLDPYMTSAWNALLVGRKRWLLYGPGEGIPPGVDEEVDSDGEKSYDAPEPMKYMVDEYELARQSSRPPLECILEAGEMIFVPTGWWHMVLNLTDTIAVTQNVMNRYNFMTVYEDVRKDDKKMKHRLKKGLRARYPDIYEKFIGDPNAPRKHKKDKKEKKETADKVGSQAPKKPHSSMN